MNQYISKLEKQYQGVVKHSEAMSKRLKEASNSLFEFGQGLNFLGQSEGDAVGNALIKVNNSNAYYILLFMLLF
jgi:putative methionine-R-sulfoxide reductase with GAF domain